VYVVDGSVHVNNGGFNPSLTIQAIAYWALGQDGERVQKGLTNYLQPGYYKTSQTSLLRV
jgi:hypothetical protein